MHAANALVDMLLGFVPFVGIALALTAGLWAATKLSPTFGEKVDAVFDRLFGVDADYDETHHTGYAHPSHNWK